MLRELFLTCSDRRFLKGLKIAMEPTPVESRESLVREVTPHRTSDPGAFADVSGDLYRIDREAECYHDKVALWLRIQTLTQALSRANADRAQLRGRFQLACAISLAACLGLAITAAALWWLGR